MADFLYTADASQPAPEFRAALRILAAPAKAPSLSILAHRGTCACCKEPLAYAAGSFIGACDNAYCVTNQLGLPL